MFLSSSQHLDRLLGPTIIVPDVGAGGVFLAVKRSEHEADHSPPSISEVKNVGAVSPLLYTPFTVGCLINLVQGGISSI
jgi:hypothetical protein